MLRLAFDITSSDGRGEIVDCLIPVRRFDAPQLVRHIGGQVLVFLPGEAGRNSFVGGAVLSGLVPSGPDSRGLVAELAQVELFSDPVEYGGLPRIEGVPWISLPAAMFEAILTNGESRGRGDLDEDEAPFAADERPPLENASFSALGTSVLRHYGNGCALTGMMLATQSSDDLRIVPIQPLAEDGPVHVTNCLPLAPAAAEAFSAGHLTVAGDLRVIVDVGRIDQDLLARLNPLGRLIVPQDEALRPDKQHLAWHRRWFFSQLE
ncbi:hypothetical protein [Devosia nitrariae]|uniref:Uncharacterized protein n=1 Tax=Devosia nitrariae TaxID=2071872 RepID=A0ABQ5WBC3_9HYPH|nr:hypothetical protein [Devosia nitrariae]GLQ57086.1 hypothetical protein GCM10010862_43450 [Devosia nitrariae]